MARDRYRLTIGEALVESERGCGPESEWPRRPSPQPKGEGSMGSRNLNDAADPLRRGGSDGTVTRASQATGEALLAPARNRRSRVDQSLVDTIVNDAIGVLKTGSPAVHGRPRFAKLSTCCGTKEKIAPVHPDFMRETNSLSLMGSAGRRLVRLHALWVPRLARTLPTTV